MDRRVHQSGEGVLARLPVTRARRDRRCVEQLTQLRARAAGDGLMVVRVTHVREVGQRGSKAWAVLDDGTRIDAWFWDATPPVDCFLLVRASIRPGSHTGTDVLFVGCGEPLASGIVEALPHRVTDAAERLGLLHAGGRHGDAADGDGQQLRPAA